MTEKSDVQHVWEQVWQHSGRDASAYLGDRFTTEAYPALREFIAPHAQSILEAGCGTGRFCCLFARDFPDSTIHGVDVSPSALEVARGLGQALRLSNVSFREASLFALPFPDNHFDCVFNEGVVQLFTPAGPPSQADALREMTRVTKPGGKVVISVINWSNWPHTFYKAVKNTLGGGYEYGYEHSFSRGELRRLLHAAGLRRIEFTGFYPSYGFHRWADQTRWGRPVSRRLGRMVDTIRAEWVRRHLGFETVACGTKPA